MRVLRFQFDVADLVELRMNEGARLLRVQAVGVHQIEMWALVDESGYLARRQLRIVGTGHRVNEMDTEKFVGTTISGPTQATRLVWHVFDLGEVVG